MKYKLLIVDHDDTAVDSTASIHHPAFIAFMKKYRPDESIMDLHGWMQKMHNPGIFKFYSNEIKLTEEEWKHETEVWRSYTSSKIPEFFPGFIDILKTFKAQGGNVAVVSHSEEANIRKHYTPTGFMPDAIYGWIDDKSKLKPSTWAVEQLMNTYNIKPEEAILIDDLSPGIKMAKAVGIPTIGVTWAHALHNIDVPELRSFMQSECDHYIEKIEDLKTILFEEDD